MRRRSCILLAVSVPGLMAFVAWRLFAHPNLRLDQIGRVAATGLTREDEYVWVNNRTLMLFRAHAGAEGSFVVQKADTAGGAPVRAPFKTSIPPGAYAFAVSPDGRKVAWVEATPTPAEAKNPLRGDRVHTTFRIAMADGSNVVSYPNGGQDWAGPLSDRTVHRKLYWMKDGSAVVRASGRDTIPSIVIPPSYALTICGTLPRSLSRSRTVRSPASAAPVTGCMEFGNLVIPTLGDSHQGFAFASSDIARAVWLMPSFVWSPAAGAQVVGSSLTVADLSPHDLEAVRKVASFQMEGESTYGYAPIDLSQDGSRIAYVCIMKEPAPAYVRLLSRLQLHVLWKPHEIQALFVCDVARRKRHLIAYADISPDTLPQSDGEIDRIKWSPDGKQMACMYHQKVYVVEAG